MKRVATAALILSLVAATAAMADGRHDRNDRRDDNGRYSRDHRDNDRRDRDRRRDHDRRDHDRRDDRRHDDRRNNDHRYHHGNRWDDRNDRHRWDNDRRDHGRYDNRYRAGKYYAPRGYYQRHWGRGDRLPRAYYARPYVIANYHSYRLRPPPRGCHYVRVNNDVVLAAIATGVILDVFYNHFY